MAEGMNSSDILRDKVVSLLNTATSEIDASQILLCLREVEEILIKRQTVDEDDRSALLHEFSSHVVEFHVKSSFKVKCFVIQFIETLAKSYPEQVLKVIDSFVNLASDPRIDVVKKVLQTGPHIYRQTMSLLCSRTQFVRKASTEVVNGANALTYVRSKLAEHIKSDIDVVRSLSVKFVENIILCHSIVTRDVNIVKTSAINARSLPMGPDSFSLNDVSKNGLLFDYGAFRKVGEIYIAKLCKLISQAIHQTSDLSIKNLRVIFNALSSLGCHRCNLLKLIIPALLESYSSFIELKEKLNMKSVNVFQTCFKSTLLKFLKLTSSVKWHSKLMSCLISLGVKDQAEKARELSAIAAVQLRNKRRSRNTYAESENTIKKRRVSVGEDSRPWPPKSNRVDCPVANLSLLTIDEVVCTVIYCVKYLPPSPPHNLDGSSLRDSEDTAPLRKLMHSMRLLNENVAPRNSRNAFSLVNHYSISKATAKSKYTTAKMELSGADGVMGRSLSSLGRSFLGQHLIKRFLKCFGCCDFNAQNNWYWCIFGRLANLRHVVSQDDLFMSNLRGMGMDTSVIASSPPKPVFWYIFMNMLLKSEDATHLLDHKKWYTNYVQHFAESALSRSANSCDFHSFTWSWSMLPMFAEAAAHKLYAGVAVDGSSRLGIDIGGKMLDYLRKASLNVISFRKGYIELILHTLITGKDGHAKKCIGIIVNDLYSKICFRTTINSAMSKLMSSVACKRTSIAKGHRGDYSVAVIDQRICKCYLLLCVKSGELLSRLLGFYAQGTPSGRQIIIRSLIFIDRSLPNLETERKNFLIISVLKHTPSNSTFLAIQLIRRIALRRFSIDCIEIVDKFIQSSENSNLWIIVPLIPYLPKSKLTNCLSRLLLGQYPIMKAVLASIIEAIKSEGSVLSPADFLVVLHLIPCPKRQNVVELIKCIKFCLDVSQNLCEAHVLEASISRLLLEKRIPLLLIRLIISFLQKHPHRHTYVLSCLPSIIAKLKPTDTLHFDGVTKCAFMMRSAESLAILLTLPRQYIVSRILSTNVYREALIEWMSKQEIESQLRDNVGWLQTAIERKFNS